MKVLILGGTGAMGAPLVALLKKAGYELYVTSRREMKSENNLHYIRGNAKDPTFFPSLFDKYYDAIIDFMVYSSSEFEKRVDCLLEKTKQYFFFSSSRVYAESQKPITEDSSRLLDVCKNQNYLQTDEYALAKARQENLLFKSRRKNWTIIRPYITYNQNRLQLGVYEKENWLYRALAGRTIVLPKDIAKSKTSLTYGPDVALAVMCMIGNESTFGQAFHVVNSEILTWGEVLGIYQDVIEKKTGKRPNVKITDSSEMLQHVWNPWQIKYDRLYDRVFDSSKAERFCGEYEYKKIRVGLEECLSTFIDRPRWSDINWCFEAWADQECGEFTSLCEIKGLKNKVKYIKRRFIT